MPVDSRGGLIDRAGRGCCLPIFALMRSGQMSIESQLREKLRKIEALFAGAGTPGERLAAEAALERVRARLAELGRGDPPVEMHFSVPDRWSRHLFLALCRRYGLAPYRYPRQRRNTIMVRAPRGFVDQVLWPEFSELERALASYLHEVTLRVIREEVYPTRATRRKFPRLCRQTEGRNPVLLLDRCQYSGIGKYKLVICADLVSPILFRRSWACPRSVFSFGEVG